MPLGNPFGSVPVPVPVPDATSLYSRPAWLSPSPYLWFRTPSFAVSLLLDDDDVASGDVNRLVQDRIVSLMRSKRTCCSWHASTVSCHIHTPSCPEQGLEVD